MYRTGLSMILFCMLAFSAYGQFRIDSDTNGELMIVTNSGNVGIGLAGTQPTEKLEVVGTIRSTGLQLADGTQGDNKVLTSDANGSAGWESLAQIGGITAVGAGDGLTGGGSSGSVTLHVGAGTGISVTSNAVSALTNDAIWNASDLQGVDITTVQPVDGQILKYDATEDAWILVNDPTNTIVTNELLDQNILPANGVPEEITSSGTFSVAYSGLPQKALYATISMTCMTTGGSGESKVWALRKNVDGSNDNTRRLNLIGQCTSSSSGQSGEVQLAKVPLIGSLTTKNIYFYAQICSGCTTNIWPYIVAIESAL